MNRIARRKPSPAVVVSSLALFVALGGTSYAAIALPNNSVGSAQIKPRAVKGSDIRASAITSTKVKAGSLLRTDFKTGELPAGAAGPEGTPGLKGDAGAAGAAGTKGADGTAGVSGAPGEIGADGTAGVKGDTGAIGLTGADGAPGAKGEQGDTGATGVRGEPGDRGPAGPSASATVRASVSFGPGALTTVGSTTIATGAGRLTANGVVVAMPSYTAIFACRVFVNGEDPNYESHASGLAGGQYGQLVIADAVSVAAGTHTVDVRCATNGAPANYVSGKINIIATG